MGLTTVEAIVDFLANGPELALRPAVVWHAGEPLTLPMRFYEEAFALFEPLEERGISATHNFQTNGTLITSKWCDFFNEHNVRIGVSIDGPQPLHDAVRVDRRGAGTFHRTMRGVHLLRKSGIDFSTIAVLTRASLRDPESMWRFIVDHGLKNVGFNVEEIEAANRSSSLNYAEVDADWTRFFRCLGELSRNEPSVRIRELAETRTRIRSTSGRPPFSSEATPGAILSFSVGGDVSTYSPELLTSGADDRYGAYHWGNVHVDSFETFKARVKSSAFASDVMVGSEACYHDCDYFVVCGGGAPSNKLAEHGHVRGSETLSCRLGVKRIADVVLDVCEAELRTPVR